MIGPVIGALVIVTVIGYSMHQIRSWWLAQRFLIFLWRFLTGHPLHGHHVTDAGWFRPGQRALTTTGHATRWQHLPRYKRTLHRTGGTVCFLAVVAGLLVNWVVTTLVLATLVLAVATLAVLYVRRLLRDRQARRYWAHPLHLAAHERMGIPRATRATDWIEVQTDVAGAVQSVRIHPPKGWPADPKDQQWLVGTVATKCAIANPKAIPALHGADPVLTVKRGGKAPGFVAFADVTGLLDGLGENEILIGLGIDEEPVVVSLHTDSPHIAISMGTGAGKSNLAGWILLQILLKGGIGLVLDAKRRLSYPWLLKDMDRNLSQLPNVAYAWTTAQIHAGMEWMGNTELDRRGDVAFAGMDTRGDVHASVGPRLFTVAEELNLAVPRLKDHWAETRGPGDPKKSPAFTGLAAGAFAGREVREHMALVGQMLTAEVTGSKDSSVRTQCGIKLMARYELPGWKMMCGDVPMPPAPTALGRVQVVTAEGVREAQVPKLDRVKARQMVLDSNMAQLPSSIPRCLVTGIPGLSESMASPADVTVTPPLAVTAAPRVMVTLKQAVERGHTRPGTTAASLKMAIWRDHQRPEEERIAPWPVARDGNKDLYIADELALFDASRR